MIAYPIRPPATKPTSNNAIIIKADTRLVFCFVEEEGVWKGADDAGVGSGFEVGFGGDVGGESDGVGACDGSK